MLCTLFLENVGVSTRNGKYSVNGILQSIFRSASRREALGKHSKGGRRGGELKNRLDKTAAQSVAYVY